MLKHNNDVKVLHDLLDSDDELPTSYKEEPDLPAYLDDQRFDAIQFSWIKSNKIRSIPAKPSVTIVKPAVTPVLVQHTLTPVPVQHPQQETLPATRLDLLSQGCSNKNLIKTGILNEEDILCMRSIVSQTADDETLLWFIDFLMYKDLQADYRFLKSCLVISLENYRDTRAPYSQMFYSKSMKNCFQLFVK